MLGVRTILRDNGMMPMLGVRHKVWSSCWRCPQHSIHASDGRLLSWPSWLKLSIDSAASAASTIGVYTSDMTLRSGTNKRHSLSIRVVGEHLSCPLAGVHNKNNIRTSRWKQIPMAHLIGIDHSMKLWPLIRTSLTPWRARVGMIAATTCYKWVEHLNRQPCQAVGAPYNLRGSLCNLLLKMLEDTPLEEVKMLRPHIVE